MSDEEKKSKQETIQQQNAETVPSGMFAKVKYYCKRYWYIAIPVHMVSSTIWFTSSYALVASGVDVLELLKTLHMPDLILDKVASAPASAGFFVIALIIYKIATPLRYATTLLGIQLTFKVLQRMGRLRTLNEVEYKVRSEYERRGRFTTQRPRGTGVRSPPIQHSVKESSKK